MDPNVALDDIHRYIRECEYRRAASTFEALDEWIQKGGFLPTAWIQNVEPINRRVGRHDRTGHPPG